MGKPLLLHRHNLRCKVCYLLELQNGLFLLVVFGVEVGAGTTVTTNCLEHEVLATWFIPQLIHQHSGEGHRRRYACDSLSIVGIETPQVIDLTSETEG